MVRKLLPVAETVWSLLLKASSQSVVIRMTAETARKALAALMEIVGEANGVEIIMEEKRDHE